MLPTLVLVGRPNVGKSTLFNRLTRSRDAIVADIPGLTRDRQYGHGRGGDIPFLVIDTGGFEPEAQSGLPVAMARQTVQAMDEADAIVFVVDARDGLTSPDRVIAEQLRRAGRRVVVAANKAEGIGRDTACAEFHELGLGDPVAVSAAHGEGIGALVEAALAGLAPADEPIAEDAAPRHPSVAVVGRPNVGKSTLVNALLGEERVIASDEPGTTRDAIRIEFEREGRRFTLIDTAGVRRRGRVEGVAEKFSVVKTLQAVEEANVVDSRARRTRRCRRAGRAPRRLRRRCRARARGRGEQVGGTHASATRAGEARSRSPTRLSCVRTLAFRFCAARNGAFRDTCLGPGRL